MKTLMTGLAALALALVAISPAGAVPVLSFDEATGGGGNQNDQSVGWQFDVLVPTVVTGLGWFDEFADGLALAHEVGIWGPGGALLRSALVPAGLGAALDGQFRTVPVAPILLPAGAGYIVGGQNFANNPERLACGAGAGPCAPALTQTLDPRFAFIDATFSPLGGFQRPTQFSAADNGFYGPSFSVRDAAVPEPGSMLLLGAGLLALGLTRRHAARGRSSR